MSTGMEPLRVAITITDDVTTLVVAGEVDVFSLPPFRAGFLQAWESATATLVADLTGVSFVDASGIGALVALCREARERGCRLVVRPSRSVRRVARLVGVDSFVLPLDPGA